MFKKILIIVGTRPEAIKMAPLYLELKKRNGISCRLCITGQHRQMLDQVLETFGMTPDTDLNLMQANQGLAQLTARAIDGIDHCLKREKPDLILVQGDTTTVFCGALAGFYNQIPIGHVEAGLRTGNLCSPWPEEANRQLTTRLAQFHFCPTENNRIALLAEGIPNQHVYVTGNTVIDALFIVLEKIKAQPPSIPGLPSNSLDFIKNQDMVLITGHRRENFGSRFEDICQAIADLAVEFPKTHFIYPVHLNPNVQDPVTRILKNLSLPNIHLIEPQSYLPFVSLMNRAKLILTDSGGVQEEAPSLGKPVLVMRDSTERPEAVTAGTVKLVGTSKETIKEQTRRLLLDSDYYASMTQAHNPYGDGHAAKRIADIITHAK